MNTNSEEMIKEMKAAGYTEEEIVNSGHINIYEMINYLRHKPIGEYIKKTEKIYEFRCPKCKNIFIPGISSGISAYSYLVQLLSGVQLNEVVGKCPYCKEYVTATKDIEFQKVKTR